MNNRIIMITSITAGSSTESNRRQITHENKKQGFFSKGFVSVRMGRGIEDIERSNSAQNHTIGLAVKAISEFESH